MDNVDITNVCGLIFNVQRFPIHNYFFQVTLPIMHYNTVCFKLYRVRQIPCFFFLENALKKTTEYFLKFIFLFESTILPVNSGI